MFPFPAFRGASFPFANLVPTSRFPQFPLLRRAIEPNCVRLARINVTSAQEALRKQRKCGTPPLDFLPVAAVSSCDDVAVRVLLCVCRYSETVFQSSRHTPCAV